MGVEEACELRKKERYEELLKCFESRHRETERTRVWNLQVVEDKPLPHVVAVNEIAAQNLLMYSALQNKRAVQERV